MQSMKKTGTGRADRVRLILDVRKGYRRLAGLLNQYRSDSPRLQAAFLRTTRELSALNRALALVAVESALD